jgi:membrane associated rhomboid family serine protease
MFRLRMLNLRTVQLPLRLPKKRSFIALSEGNSPVLPVIGGIFCSNVLVYCGWKYAETNRSFYSFMDNNFTVSRLKVFQYPHTIITSFFSQQDFYHLISNLMTIFFFGPTCLTAIGARAFLALYFGAGVFANGCHLYYYKNPRTKGLGASGALNAIVTWSILTNPFMLIFVFADFIPIPLPAILYGGLFIGKDVAALFHRELELPFGLGRSLGMNIGHAAHVGGACCGALYFIATRGRGGGRGGPWKRWD